jgi:hypothetical protein
MRERESVFRCSPFFVAIYHRDPVLFSDLTPTMPPLVTKHEYW